MHKFILVIVSTLFLEACSSVSEQANVAANPVDDSQHSLNVLVENPIVGGIFYVLEATVNGAERGTNALLRRVR